MQMTREKSKMSTKNARSARDAGSTRNARSAGSARNPGGSRIPDHARSAGSSRNAGEMRYRESAGSSRRYAESEGGTRRRAESMGSSRRHSESSGSARRYGESAGSSRRYAESAGGSRRYAESAGGPRRSGSGRGSGGRRLSAKKRAAKRRKRIILFAAEIILLFVMLGVLYTVMKTEKMEKIKIDEENIVMEMNETVETNEVMKGYRNIALFGVDSREGSLGKGTRSDTIIIASINQDTGDVKLISVFRDTYLNLGNDTYNKCNAAYAKGGPEQAIMMLNRNLDLNITDYITVGFDGLIEVIDALGGVEINVTDAEVSYLNDYQISMVGTTSDGVNFTAKEGVDYTPVEHGGLQTLNGLQATAYCRIRYIGNDFQRAQRQRDVIMAVSEKAKKADVGTLNDIANGVMGNISTSLDIKEILSVMKDLPKYSIVANDGFPFEQYRTTGTVKKGSCVIPMDLERNVVELHRFLFDESDYQVSPEVQEFSKKVSSDTGKYADTAADEFTQKEENEVAAADEGNE